MFLLSQGLFFCSDLLEVFLEYMSPAGTGGYVLDKSILESI